MGDRELTIRAETGQSAYEVDLTSLGINYDTMRIVLRFVYAKATSLRSGSLGAVRSAAKLLGFKPLDRAVKRLQQAPAPPDNTAEKEKAQKILSHCRLEEQPHVIAQSMFSAKRTKPRWNAS